MAYSEFFNSLTAIKKWFLCVKICLFKDHLEQSKIKNSDQVLFRKKIVTKYDEMAIHSPFFQDYVENDNPT